MTMSPTTLVILDSPYGVLRAIGKSVIHRGPLVFTLIPRVMDVIVNNYSLILGSNLRVLQLFREKRRSEVSERKITFSSNGIRAVYHFFRILARAIVRGDYCTNVEIIRSIISFLL